MSNIKPTKVELYLIYICPKCSCEWTKTTREVKLLGGMICGGCGYHIKFAPIERVRIKPVYKVKQVSEKIEKPAESVLTSIQQDAIMALTKLGFPQKQSKEFVKQHQFQSVEDYIQAAVRKGTE